MPIRKVKPTSAGRRFITFADYAEITKTQPEKSLTDRGRKLDRRVGEQVADRLATAAPIAGSED